MRLFRTPPYRDVQELLDVADEATESELTHTLRDIRRANIFGMGTWVVLTHLETMLWERPTTGPITILDLATGSADIPQAVCRWAETNGHRIRFVATDISEEILGVARERIVRAGLAAQVDFVVCDATRTPFAERSFDYVTCSLALHHLNLEQARAALREMARLARRGFIVNDVYRSQGAWYMAWVLTRLTTTNRLTRHDGPASVYRAFTPREVTRLAREAGVRLEVHTHPFWRMAAIGRPNQA
jgi:ubiquinone/menaquinone biosynthesis C-methylase UbiE